MKSAHSFYPIRYIASLLWVGFVAAISFMEAPLKFQAPSVTLGIGLEIGKLVFNTLNKIEWVLLLSIFVSLIVAGFNRRSMSIVIVLAVILFIQTFILLPLLNARADLIISSESVPVSNIHLYYVGIECIKLLLLIYISFRFIYQNTDTGVT